MAIDASIPLGYQPPQVTSPLDVAKGMMTLQDSMQTRQLKQLEISDYLESKQKHEKVQQLAQNKTLFDPQQGWTPEGIANVMAIDSELGGKIQQGQERTAMMQSQLQAAKAQQQDVALKRAKARQDMGLEIANNAASYWNSSEGKPPADRAAGYKETYQQSLQRMKDSGMWEAAGGTPEQFKHDFENPPPPEVAKAFSIKAQQAESKNKYEERERPLPGDKIQKEFRNNPTEPWKPLGAPANKFGKQVVSPDQGGPQPTEDTLEMDAYRYLTDGTLPPNMGRGAQGSGQATKIRNEASRLAKDMGMGMDEIRFAQLENKTKVAALGQLAKAKAQILQFEKTAEANAELALQAGRDVWRSGSPWINKPLNVIKQQGMGDPKFSVFNAANETFVSEYARVMSGGYGAAQTTEGAQTRAHGLLNTSMSLPQYEAVVKQLKAEMKNREKALNDQMQEERDNLRGIKVKPMKKETEAPSEGALQWSDADEKRLQELEKKHGAQ